MSGMSDETIKKCRAQALEAINKFRIEKNKRKLILDNDLSSQAQKYANRLVSHPLEKCPIKNFAIWGKGRNKIHAVYQWLQMHSHELLSDDLALIGFGFAANKEEYYGVYLYSRRGSLTTVQYINRDLHKLAKRRHSDTDIAKCKKFDMSQFQNSKISASPYDNKKGNNNATKNQNNCQSQLHHAPQTNPSYHAKNYPQKKIVYCLIL